MDQRLMQIGELAARCGVSRDTVRHYGRLGLLPSTSRTAAGYRQFPRSAVNRVLLVRSAVRFGFSLAQVAGFLRARDTGGAPCRQVRAAAAGVLTNIEQEIAELSGKRDRLRETLADWDARLAQAPRGTAARLLEALPR
jgi:DNA-binding transcriptional MerR regulator